MSIPGRGAFPEATSTNSGLSACVISRKEHCHEASQLTLLIDPVFALDGNQSMDRLAILRKGHAKCLHMQKQGNAKLRMQLYFGIFNFGDTS